MAEALNEATGLEFEVRRVAVRSLSKERAFPIELDPFEHTRSEMAAFARDCKSLGVNYIGTCCGAGPHHVRAIAEALAEVCPVRMKMIAVDDQFASNGPYEELLGPHIDQALAKDVFKRSWLRAQ